MTDEERQNLCDKLRNRTIRIMPKVVCETAANELERLANELASVKNELKLWKEQG